MNKTTVIFHRADFDGIFCGQIAKKFLPEADLIGWDYADKPLELPDGTVYILDLPVDRVFGFTFAPLEQIMPMFDWLKRVIWIDHHCSSIASHPKDIPGYRIDGVSACRLAWQWFSLSDIHNKREVGETWNMLDLPAKEAFVNCTVVEPEAVKLVGQHDVWDHRDPRAEMLQYGLKGRDLSPETWRWLLTVCDNMHQNEYDLGMTNLVLSKIVAAGKQAQAYQQCIDKAVMEKSFIKEFEGLKFLVVNMALCNSITFASRDVPETGHDALMKFYFDGAVWSYALYHARHNTDINLAQIAAKYGGGGHKGACGFTRSGSLW